LWSSNHEVVSIDLRTKQNVLDLSDTIGTEFDFVCAAPPCDQFTKACSAHWESYPKYFIAVAQKCFNICVQSQGLWFLENPPGRIEKFIPALTAFRMCTWSSSTSNKEYIIYSNFMIVLGSKKRYGYPSSEFNNKSKRQREAWDPELIRDIERCLPTIYKPIIK
jgi:hypothetical protein